MKYFFIRSQLVFVSVILLITFGMMLAIVMRFNSRWDFTKEKVYSLSGPTVNLLKELQDDKLEVLAFYPKDDPARKGFEFFLKESQLVHSHLEYNFYDPDRVPRLAKQHHINELYTVIIQYGDRRERIVGPSEEAFSNALLRLANPKQYELCFVTGHGEASLFGDDRDGYQLFKQSLEDSNYTLHEILLSRDGVPEQCHAIIAAGPHRDYDVDEFALLKKAFKKGRGILFLIDPMDPGTGSSFRNFMDDLGVALGEDVIVDKMSRMVGGDFLVPLVSQYVTEHPITDQFEQPTFFPVARSVQPNTEEKEGVEVVPLALSGSGSWAESNLNELENGEAAFDSTSDLSGPICVAVAVEETNEEDVALQGRLVVVGDSDFLANAYIDLSGNKNIALNMMKWLVKDERFISILTREPEFKPLFVDVKQRFLLLLFTIGLLPGFFLVLGAIHVLWRRRST